MNYILVILFLFYKLTADYHQSTAQYKLSFQDSVQESYLYAKKDLRFFQSFQDMELSCNTHIPDLESPLNIMCKKTLSIRSLE